MSDFRKYVSGLTQDETAELVTIALSALEDDLAIKTVTQWAAKEDLAGDLAEALEDEGEAEDEDEDEDGDDPGSSETEPVTP